MTNAESDGDGTQRDGEEYGEALLHGLRFMRGSESIRRTALIVVSECEARPLDPSVGGRRRGASPSQHSASPRRRERMAGRDGLPADRLAGGKKRRPSTERGESRRPLVKWTYQISDSGWSPLDHSFGGGPFSTTARRARGGDFRPGKTRGHVSGTRSVSPDDS